MHDRTSRLLRGQAFESQVARDFSVEELQRPVSLASGRVGRVDVMLNLPGEFVALAEIKGSDWDAMSDRAVVRNTRRQVEQLLRYASAVQSPDPVRAGIIFPQPPATAGRAAFIEREFERHGIAVIWHRSTSCAD